MTTSIIDPFDELLDEIEEKSFAENRSQKQQKLNKSTKNIIEDLEPEELKSHAQSAIMRYLARREYSKKELHQRLQQKGYPKDVINDLLVELGEDDWQSDLRCAEMLLSHGYKSGWGPNKIRAQMQQKGIKSDVISEVFFQFEDRLFNYKSGLPDQKSDLSNHISASSHKIASTNTSNAAGNQKQIQKLQEIIDNYTPDTTSKSAQLDMLDLDDGDWSEKALAAARKKFGQSFGRALEKDLKNKAKLQRFLYNKGFENEHISFVLKNYNS